MLIRNLDKFVMDVLVLLVFYICSVTEILFYTR